MNRHARRATAAETRRQGDKPDPLKNFKVNVVAMSAEAAGVMHLDIVLREDMPDLVEAAALGNPEAAALHDRVIIALSGIVNAPADKPKLCAVCPKPLWDGRFSLAIVTPACDDPRNGLALAVCDDCAETRQAVRDKATEAVKRIWPDARPFTVTHPEGGRA